MTTTTMSTKQSKGINATTANNVSGVPADNTTLSKYRSKILKDVERRQMIVDTLYILDNKPSTREEIMKAQGEPFNHNNNVSMGMRLRGMVDSGALIKKGNTFILSEKALQGIEHNLPILSSKAAVIAAAAKTNGDTNNGHNHNEKYHNALLKERKAASSSKPIHGDVNNGSNGDNGNNKTNGSDKTNGKTAFQFKNEINPVSNMGVGKVIPTSIPTFSVAPNSITSDPNPNAVPITTTVPDMSLPFSPLNLDTDAPIIKEPVKLTHTRKGYALKISRAVDYYTDVDSIQYCIKGVWITRKLNGNMDMMIGGTLGLSDNQESNKNIEAIRITYTNGMTMDIKGVSATDTISTETNR